MSKPRRNQVARRGPPTSSDGLARERILALDRLLKDDAIGGRLDHDREFRDRILAHGFNALHELVIMGHDPQYPPSVRALAQFKVSDHLLQPLKPIDAAGEVGVVDARRQRREEAAGELDHDPIRDLRERAGLVDDLLDVNGPPFPAGRQMG